MTENKKPSRYLHLKDNHPTMVKLNKLNDLAIELGIQISFMRGWRTIVQDNERDTNLPALYLEEIDDGQAIEEFPPTFEYKVIYDNPEYLTALKQEQEEYDKNRAQRERDDAEIAVAAQKAKEEKRARELEQQERAELARLKNKYQE